MRRMRHLGRGSLRPALIALLTATLAGTGTAGALPARTSAPAADAVEVAASKVGLAPVDEGLEERILAVPDRAGESSWDTEPFTMLGATWSGDGSGHGAFTLEFSHGRGAGWTAWEELEEAEHGPTDGEREGVGRRGSDLRWVGATQRLRIRTRGDVPGDLEITLIDTSGAGVGASRTTSSTVLHRAARTVKAAKPKKKHDHAPRPRVRGRKKWGANERWRDGTRTTRRHMKSVHVHHTASSNRYRRKDVPGIIQGFYRYHTKSLGWSDLGYNYLVDRFGRGWKGRAGGWMVQGAHTLGFNHNSIGVAVIGDFRSTKPRPKVVRTVVRIAAWHLDKGGARAKGKVDVISKGSDRYAKGKKVRLPRIAGHRRTNHTACPGQRLAKKLPQIRKRAQRRVNRF